MDVRAAGNPPGMGLLLRDIAQGSAELVRGEATLARLELGAAATGIGKGTGFMAVATVLALLGSLSLFSGVILLVGDQWLPRDLYWLGALLVVAISGALAVLFANRGRRLLSPSSIAPDQTIATLKEDTEWLKQQMKSGVTSN